MELLFCACPEPVHTGRHMTVTTPSDRESVFVIGSAPPFLGLSPYRMREYRKPPRPQRQPGCGALQAPPSAEAGGRRGTGMLYRRAIERRATRSRDGVGGGLRRCAGKCGVGLVLGATPNLIPGIGSRRPSRHLFIGTARQSISDFFSAHSHPPGDPLRATLLGGAHRATPKEGPSEASPSAPRPSVRRVRGSPGHTGRGVPPHAPSWFVHSAGILLFMARSHAAEIRQPAGRAAYRARPRSSARRAKHRSVTISGGR